MKISTNIYQRLKSLRLTLKNIDQYYNDIAKDHYIDAGIDYTMEYPDNDETHAMFKRAEDLYQLRKDKLFTEIFSFSQTFCSLKDYLNGYAPSKKSLIENFFSNEKINLLSRKQMANDLKHNPKKDLVFDIRVVKKETIKEPGKITHISYIKHSWFYDKIEAVEYCHQLYVDLIIFMKANFSYDGH